MSSYKKSQAQSWVNGYAVTGAGIVIAAVVPGATSAVLMTLEATMCFHIGKIYRGSDYKWKEATAAAGAVGLAAVAGKLIALEALTLIPFAGWAAKAPIAGGIIKVLGEAIIDYYEKMESYSSTVAFKAPTIVELLTASPKAILAKPPQKIITFVGKTGEGKSSTINALVDYQAFKVGAEHGTTTTVDSIDYINGYSLQDTPGLLDDDAEYLQLIADALRESELVIYTTRGQLYEPELEVVRQIRNFQQQWNRDSGTSGLRKLLLYVNMQDVKEQTMPSSVRTEEAALIKSQVAEWIPEGKVAFGAAAPVLKNQIQPARIDELQELILQFINS